MRLNLASASPRRAELLGQIGIKFDQFAVDIDENVFPNESPEKYLNRIIELKLNAGQYTPPVPVLTTITSDATPLIIVTIEAGAVLK